MNTQQDSLAAALFEHFNARDAAKIGDLLALDVQHFAPGSQFGADLEGRASLVQYFAETVFPKFRKIEFRPWKIYRLPDEGTEIVEWRGEFLTRDGVTFQSRGVFVLEHDGRHIHRMREYFDTEKTRGAFAAGAESQP